MIIIPAIDLIKGRCVRLVQGDYDRETVYSDNPVDVATMWCDKGAEFMHLVDLDGASSGQPMNIGVIERIVNEISNIKVQVGGGIRNNDTVEKLLNAGVNRVIIGTKAVQCPDWIGYLCDRFPGRIAVSIDTRNGNIATAGWRQTEDIEAVGFVRKLTKYDLSAVIVTDIKKDGMLDGPNLELMDDFVRAIDPIPLVASGGVTTIEDIKALSALGLYGAIIGKSLYDNKIELEDAIRACG